MDFFIQSGSLFAARNEPVCFGFIIMKGNVPMPDSQIYYEKRMDPVLFRLVQLRPSTPSWQKQLLLIYVNEGSVSLTLNGAGREAGQSKLILIPPMSIYSISAGQGTAASFLVDIDRISSCCPDFQFPDLHPAIIDTTESSYNRKISDLLSGIIRSCASEQHRTLSLEYMINGIQLVSLLSDYHVKEPADFNSPSEILPILKAVSFTAANFRNPISLADAAKEAGFSAPYFSRKFSDFMGISFSDYLKDLRLSAAQQQLTSGFSIVQIASECGFPDHRAFTRAYRKKYGINPSKGRKQISGQYEAPASVTSKTSIGKMLTSCIDNLNSSSDLPIRFRHTILPEVSLRSERTLFPHAWQESIGIGRARHMLYAVNQDMLRELQSKIYFKHGVLHGLFDDDMQVVHERSDGSWVFSFDNIDTLFDFLLSIGMEPVVQLGFMPSPFAKDRTNYIYEGLSISSLPQSMDNWCSLVHAFILHLFHRYGQQTVENWEFCLWSKPDSAPLPFGIPSVSSYFEFYRRTYITLKKCSRKISFGSPAFLPDSLADDTWVKDFFSLCRKFKCLPDRIRFDFYPMFFPDEHVDIAAAGGIQHHPNSGTMSSALTAISSFCKENDLPYLLPELEEWNFSISQRELINDTAYKAVYIVKNVLECWDKSSDFSYWGFTDTLGETPLAQEFFHGGLGLFAKGRLKKPSFYAFFLLSKLGDQLIAQGDGYIVTVKGSDVQVLFYNYCHYSSLFASGNGLTLSPSNRYAAFVDQRKNRFSLLLTKFINGRYLLTKCRLNREHGSVFDTWMNMGMIAPSSQTDYDYLQGSSQPQIEKSYVDITDSQYHIVAELEPFEVCLFEFQAAEKYV